jgi:hypothetical protein
MRLLGPEDRARLSEILADLEGKIEAQPKARAQAGA